MVETRSTGIGQVTENARILELPLVGRAGLRPGHPVGRCHADWGSYDGNRAAYPGHSDFFDSGKPQWRKHRHAGRCNAQRRRVQHALPLPFPDALQEFKVETSSLPAQYGFHSERPSMP